MAVTRGASLEMRECDGVPVPGDFRPGGVNGLTFPYLYVERTTRAIYALTPGGVVVGVGGSAILPFITPQMYGAVGDGVHDDTQAVKDALAAGLYVLIPPAPVSYLLSGQITVSRTGQTIIGSGVSSLFTGALGTSVVFAVQSASNVTIEGIAVAGTHSFGVYIVGGSGHVVRGCDISGGVNGISGGATQRGGIYVGGSASRVRIEDNDLHGNGDNSASEHGYDILGNFGGEVLSDSWITGNRCRSTAVNYNIGVYDPLRVAVTGNNVSGAVVNVPIGGGGRGGYGIMLYKTVGFAQADVGGCVVEGNTVNGVEGTGIYNQGVQRSRIANNHVEDSCSVQTDGGLSVAGIALDDVSADSVVVGNTIIDSGKDGIQVTAPSPAIVLNAVVTGNVVRNVAQNGITVRAGVTDVLIEANSVYGFAGVGIGSYANAADTRVTIRGNRVRHQTNVNAIGISQLALGTDWTVEGNEVSDVTDRLFSLLGTATRVANNREDGAQFPEGVSIDRGDNSITVKAGIDFAVQRFETALTADRTVTLDTNNVWNGARFRVVRTGLGAHTLDVGGVKTIANSTAAFVEVEWVGNVWRLIGYGAL